MKTGYQRSFLYIGLPLGIVAMLLMAMFVFMPSGAVAAPDAPNNGTDMLITGIMDGPLPYGLPKAVEFYVLNDIADLSAYGFGSANNGGGSDGEEFTFPADSANAGDFIYVASESTEFNNWFGFAPDYTSSAAGINGDDAIELFHNSVVVDVFGDINVDGTGEPWEHLDGWAYRNDATGPDSSTFILGNWSFSGPNALDGESSNDTAVTPFPTGTYSLLPTFDLSKHALTMVSPGEHFTYTLTITNSTGVSTTGTIITDVVPAGATFVSASDGGVYASGVVTWTVPGVFTDSTSISRTFEVIAPSTAGSEVVNEYYAVHATEWVTLTYGAPVTTSISPLDLIVTKTGPEYAIIGEEITYTIEVSNQGITTAHNLVVTDTLPISLTNIISSSNALTVISISGPDRIVWNFGDVFSNTTETIYLTGTVDAGVANGTVLTNTVEANTDTAGDNPANNSAEVQTTVFPESSPVIINEADADMAGTEVDEFVELYDGGLGNTSLSGLVVVLYNGSNDTSYRAIYLNGYSTDANGYFVIGGTGVAEADLVVPNTYWLQNGQDAIALYIGDAAMFPNGTPVTTDNLIDALVYDTDDNDDPGLLVLLNASQPQVDENGASDKDAHSNQRCPDGSGGARNTDTYEQYLPTPGSENTCVIPPIADLELSKTVDNPNPDESDTIIYTLSLLNNTASEVDATNVIVRDYLPYTTTITYVDNSCGATLTDNTLTWNVGAILTGTVTTCDITVTIQAGTDGTYFANYAEVYASDQYDTDSTPGNFSSTPSEDDEAGVWVTVGTPPVCGTAATFIHTIQGSGDASPEDGNIHTIEGVVVGDYQSPGGGIDGFFVQEENTDVDTDPMTSEGILVYDGYFGFNVGTGDIVRVTGTVDEYYDLTELTDVSEIVLCGTGETVTPITVTLPISDLANWEWYEGMSLYIPQTLYVTEHYNLGRYGQVSLSVNDRLDIPTQVATPGTAANALQALNDRSRVQLDDARTNQNPDPIIHPSPELSATNTLRGGDTLPNLTGVLYYSFGSYMIEPVAPLDFTHSNPRPAAPAPVSGSIEVASFNVLNYFTTLDTIPGSYNGPYICGPNADQECRGANTATELTRQRVKIITAILDIDADIVGLMEMENHPTDAALDDLVTGLNAVAGAGTYAKIDTGTIGDDAIKVAFIYKPAIVTPVGNPAILDDTFDADYYDDYNRPALAQTFQEIATDAVFTVVVNHFKSKGSDCDAIGDPDIGDGQGNCNLTRTSAANVMLDWLATDPTLSGDPRFLIIGDLNSYALEDPLVALAGGGFTDLYSTLGEDVYSYVFDGQWGTLDYGLANAAMLHYVTAATAWHINSDEPYVLDYNEDFKSAHHIASLYSDGPYRASDHDPIIISLDLTKPFIIYLPIINR